jgi:hypothetical protein
LIKDLQAVSPAKHDYVGTDVVESLYPVPPPERTQFQNQSIQDPFPQAWLGTFDIIHQRLVMAAAAPDTSPVAVVQRLADLLRHGGWLQMVEVVTEPVATNPPSVNQYIDMLATLYSNLYAGTEYQASNPWALLPHHMETVGLKNVHKEIVEVRYGALVEDASVQRKSMETATDGVKNFLAVLSSTDPQKLF